MPDDNLSQLLDRAAGSYSPDTSKALAKVKARSNRARRTRTVSILVLLIGVVAGSLALVLTVSGQQTADAVRYLRISPAVRIVDLPAASTKGPSGLSDVYFADSQHGIGLDQHCELSPTTNTVCALAIVRTNDAGRRWKPVGETLHVTYPHSRASYPFIDFATNGKDGWIYGSETFVTHDGGKSFEKDGPGGLVMDLSILGQETWALSRPCPPGVPGCSSTVFSTPTGGGPWHALHGAPKLEYPYLQLVRTSPDDAFLAAQATDGTLYSTTDGGTSWVRYPPPSLCDQLQHLTASSGHEVWVLCAGPAPGHSQPKELFHSVNDGKSWALVATSTPSPSRGIGVLPAQGIVTLVTFVSPDRLLIAFNQGSPIASTDGGRTWKPQGLPSSAGVKQLSFTDAQHGWAVLYPNNVLYRTADGGIQWTRASS
jgi:photosystem II stability/assembly factor-like uncharacterized protein